MSQDETSLKELERRFPDEPPKGCTCGGCEFALHDQECEVVMVMRRKRAPVRNTEKDTERPRRPRGAGDEDMHPPGSMTGPPVVLEAPVPVVDPTEFMGPKALKRYLESQRTDADREAGK